MAATKYNRLLLGSESPVCRHLPSHDRQGVSGGLSQQRRFPYPGGQLYDKNGSLGLTDAGLTNIEYLRVGAITRPSSIQLRRSLRSGTDQPGSSPLECP